jgi:hypothetical protein
MAAGETTRHITAPATAARQPRGAPPGTRRRTRCLGEQRQKPAGEVPPRPGGAIPIGEPAASAEWVGVAGTPWRPCRRTTAAMAAAGPARPGRPRDASPWSLSGLCCAAGRQRVARREGECDHHRNRDGNCAAPARHALWCRSCHPRCHLCVGNGLAGEMTEPAGRNRRRPWVRMGDRLVHPSQQRGPGPAAHPRRPRPRRRLGHEHHSHLQPVPVALPPPPATREPPLERARRHRQLAAGLPQTRQPSTTRTEHLGRRIVKRPAKPGRPGNRFGRWLRQWIGSRPRRGSGLSTGPLLRGVCHTHLGLTESRAEKAIRRVRESGPRDARTWPCSGGPSSEPGRGGRQSGAYQACAD